MFDDPLTIEAGPQTDWFVDPADGGAKLDAPAVLRPAEDGDFLLSAQVGVDFGATFDAGVLVLRRDERNWAKLCFEYSPDAEPMVVSVVTRGVSDDANSTVIVGSAVWLRVARIGRAHAFHYSTDGRRWCLARHFALAPGEPIEIGFLAQSPTGEGCRATFTEVSFSRATLASLRDGT